MGKLLDIDDSDICIIEEIENKKKKQKTYRKCSGVGGKVPRNQIQFRPIRKLPTRKSLRISTRSSTGGQTEKTTAPNSSSDHSGDESDIEILYEQEEGTGGRKCEYCGSIESNLIEHYEEFHEISICHLCEDIVNKVDIKFTLSYCFTKPEIVILSRPKF